MTNKDILKQLGEKLKAFRLKMNVSQQYIAEKVGIGLSSVNKIEKGNPVSIDILISYLRALQLLEGLDQLVPQDIIGPSDLLQTNGVIRKKAGKKKPSAARNYFE